MHEVVHFVQYMKENMEINVGWLAARTLKFIQHRLANSIKVNGTNIFTIGVLEH